MAELHSSRCGTRKWSPRTPLAFLLAMSLLNTPTQSWILNTEGDYQTLSEAEEANFRWTMPESTSSADGLGKGLTYAIDRDLCDSMTPTMEWFTTCDEVKTIIKAAFDTWESHASITFNDISEECAFTSNLPQHDCKDMEISLQAYNPTIHSKIRSVEGDFSAVMLPTTVATNPRRTDGQSGIGGTITKVDIYFNNTQCWYLDQQFCSSLHWLYQDNTYYNITRGSILGIYTLLACPFIFYLFKTLCLVRRKKRVRYLMSAKRFFRKSAWVHMLVTFWLSCLVIIPVLYLMLARCMDCSPFEQVVAHEIGHALGLGHADDQLYSNKNFYVKESTSDRCPLTSSSIETTNYDITRPTLMTTYQDRKLGKTCASQDDFDAINYLYPCPGVEHPECNKVQSSMGFFRSMCVIGAPLVVVFLIINTLACMCRRGKLKDEEELEGMLDRMQYHAFKEHDERETVEMYTRWQAKKTAPKVAEKLPKSMKVVVPTFNTRNPYKEVTVSQKQIKEIKVLWDTFPINEAGTIAGSELRHVLESLGYMHGDAENVHIEPQEMISFESFVHIFVRLFSVGQPPPQSVPQSKPEHRAQRVASKVDRMRTVWDDYCDPKSEMCTHAGVEQVLKGLDYRFDRDFLEKIWELFSIDPTDTLNFNDFVSLYIPMFNHRQMSVPASVPEEGAGIEMLSSVEEGGEPKVTGAGTAAWTKLRLLQKTASAFRSTTKAKTDQTTAPAVPPPEVGMESVPPPPYEEPPLPDYPGYSENANAPQSTSQKDSLLPQ